MHTNVIQRNNNLYILNFFVFSIVFKLLHNVLYFLFSFFLTRHLHLVSALTCLYVCPHYIKCIFRLSFFLFQSLSMQPNNIKELLSVPCYFQFALDVIWVRSLFLKDFNYTVAIFKNNSMLSGKSLIEIFIRLTGLKWFSFQLFFDTTALPFSAWSSIASQDRSKISRQVGSGRIVLGIKVYKSLWGWFFCPGLLLLTTINHAEVHSALLV